MKIKIPLVIFLFFNLFATLYLISPTPQLPDLPNSAKSDEPGDTIQIPNVSAYYTNLSRTEVINFYKASYNGLFRIQLNHPPEKSREIIRDTIQSYYLEEIVLPYKETVYINGFEWQKDVFTKPDKRVKNKLFFKGKEYPTKITIRVFPVPIYQRLISFYFTELTILFSLALYARKIS